MEARKQEICRNVSVVGESLGAQRMKDHRAEPHSGESESRGDRELERFKSSLEKVRLSHRLSIVRY